MNYRQGLRQGGRYSNNGLPRSGEGEGTGTLAECRSFIVEQRDTTKFTDVENAAL